MNLIDFSGDAFVVAFALYCAAFILYALAVMGRRFRKRDPETHLAKWGKIAFVTATIGLIGHLVYFFTRWAGSGHVPVSNMYEFMSFLSMAIMIAFLVLYFIYKKSLLGLFALPLAILIMAYAAVFPQQVQPLIPSLQSYWLGIHVTLAALGDAFFAIGFIAGLMHLLRTVNFSRTDKASRREQLWLELCMFAIVILIGFIVSVYGFRTSGYQAEFNQTLVDPKTENSTIVKVEYNMPPLVAPYKSETESMQSFLGMKSPLMEAPSWMHGVNAGRKLNTVIWSLLTGVILYGLLRLILRKPLAKFIQPALNRLDPDDLDEISYRAIAIGFPVFTLGGLIFAMIWAEIAWGRFWGWDPKEVWALITWLFYSVYLHLRLSRGWQGKYSSWLSVIGFIVVMFTLVGVNLIIAGLHSYAGTD
ncbi:cytochrome C biogenesis protein [Bacillus sp. FJAT-18019]|uniref:Cytochrome C biogenesis protein n=1 Tax=Paenibacillus solani TaxID=1705565 RepID=A0A0M1P2K4_9BACL|nr:c-type cytochrome biogenesis protein CcsB [Paenibacillus solani]KOP63871.1 cytochrome C biogenesis protein [Bacillus sp. FJAT-18019]KOR88711.1 cytochrome C biogenesis protein [Paenibacillus solani]